MKVLLVIVLLLLTGCGAQNELIELEDSNAFGWQKYMSKEEFHQLKKEMTYEEVVSIAKGAGELVEDEVYRWPDEQLMTQAYEVTFKENKLVSKEIIMLHGNSARDREEKAPAVPGE